MKSRHSIGLALLAITVLAAALLPPQRPEALPPMPQVAQTIFHYGRFSARARHLRYIIDIATIKDSVLSRNPTGVTAGLVFQRDNDVPELYAQYLDGRLRNQWNELRGDTGADVVVSVLLGKARVVQEGIQQPSSRTHEVYYLMPKVNEQTPCLMIVRLSPTLLHVWRQANVNPTRTFTIAREPDLGPCAFYARFGTPGRNIGAWLARQRFRAAASADWVNSTRPAAFGEMRSGWYERMPAPALECTAGNRASCRELALRMNTASLANSWQTGNEPLWPASWLILRDMAPFNRRFLTDWALGGHEAHFLSDLIRDIGEDQFQAFWGSNAPVEQAFRDATGRDLGDWTYEWLTDTIGSHRSRPLLPGVLFATGVLAAVIAIGSATLVSAKRQVA